MGVIKGDTRSLDYDSFESLNPEPRNRMQMLSCLIAGSRLLLSIRLGFRVSGLGLGSWGHKSEPKW